MYDQLITPGKRHHVFEARDELGQPRVSSNPLVSVSFFDPRSRIPEQPSVRQEVWKYREYTGSIVAKEIAERWYHTGLFILDAEDHLLPKFLSTDVWEHNAVPGEYVRHLQLNIQPDTLDFGRIVNGILENFEHLSTIANKSTEILFNLSWKSRHGDLRSLVAMLKLIGPTIRRLRAEGYKKVKIHQVDFDVCQKDLTPIHDDLAEIYPESPQQVSNSTLRREIIRRLRLILCRISLEITRRTMSLQIYYIKSI